MQEKPIKEAVKFNRVRKREIAATQPLESYEQNETGFWQMAIFERVADKKPKQIYTFVT